MKIFFQKIYNSELFVQKIELKSSRLVWITVGSFLTYNYFSTYLRFKDIRNKIFQKNYKSFHEKYQENHFIASKSTIDFQGYPDQGDWIYSKEMPESELKEILISKEMYDNSLKEFSIVLPLFIISGLWTPLITSCLEGWLIFVNRKIALNLNMEDDGMDTYKNYIINGLILNAFISSLGLRFF